MKKVLVVGAHPDDEILGCGGTVAKHVNRGDLVISIIACEGHSVRALVNKSQHQEQIVKANNIIGVKEIKLLQLPDQGLDMLPLTKIIDPIISIVREFQPNIVYCQWGGDVNRDHKLLFEATLVATRPSEKYIEEIIAFDTASSTEWGYPRSFVPDTWIEITDTLDLKIRALAEYKTEMCDYPHPRSLKAIENRALAWGNECVMHAAEAFMTIRRVRRDA